MNRYVIGSLWDRHNRIGANKNFEYLFEGRRKTDELNYRAEGILNEAQKTNNMNKDVQKQVDDLIIHAGESDAEVIQARGEEALLRDRLNKADTQLAKTIEGEHERIVNVLALGALGKNVSDDTIFIQEAVNKANTYRSSSNAVGGNNYYNSNGVVKIPPGQYGISSTIDVPVGVNLDMSGAVFVAITPDQTIDCFNIVDNAFRNNHLGGTFVGFKRAVALSTKNLNTSKIVFDGISFFSCKIGLDTISYEASRSTVLNVKNYLSVNTDQPFRVHCDMVHLSDGWVSHTGYDGAAIYNQGYTKIDNSIFVPSPTQTGARPRWIDNHPGGSSVGERGVNLEHNRFGGEEGSMPLIFNYSGYEDFSDNVYSGSVIDINNNMIFSSGSGEGTAIVLFDIPNRISIKNSSGIHNLTKGLVSCDSSFDSTLVETSRFISIFIDSSMKGATRFPLVEKDLHRFLMTDDTPYNAFRRTFKDGKFYGKYRAESSDNEKAKVTLKINSPFTATSAGQQRDLGLSFLVSISASSKASFNFKSQSLYVISVTRGQDGGATQNRINHTLLASHGGGGNAFSEEASIISAHWGSNYVGNKDIAATSMEENLSIVFNGGNNSDITVLPLFGIDNYS